MREREQRAEARSIAPAAAPALGRGRRREQRRGQDRQRGVRATCCATGFDGPLYPVNPEARHVARRAAPTRSVLDVPDDVDLAVIAVPAAAVPSVVEQCGARGRARAGRDLRRLRRARRRRPSARAAGRRNASWSREARAHGMRVVGPNCLGVVNTDPAVSAERLARAAVRRSPGGPGSSASPARWASPCSARPRGAGSGCRRFVSAGNRADVSGNDLLQYWETDERTDVVAACTWRASATRASSPGWPGGSAARKPIVAVKSGRGRWSPGCSTPRSRCPKRVVRALFEASGVIRVETVGELFDVALLLTSQPLPARRPGGRRRQLDRARRAGRRRAAPPRGCRSAGSSTSGSTPAPDAFGDGAAAARRRRRASTRSSPCSCRRCSALPASDVAAALREAAAARSDKPVLSTFLGFEGVPAALAVPGDAAPARLGPVLPVARTGGPRAGPRGPVRALASRARPSRRRRLSAWTSPRAARSWTLCWLTRQAVAGSTMGRPRGCWWRSACRSSRPCGSPEWTRLCRRWPASVRR